MSRQFLMGMEVRAWIYIGTYTRPKARGSRSSRESSIFKLARFVPFDAPIVATNAFYQQGQETLRTMLLVITE